MTRSPAATSVTVAARLLLPRQLADVDMLGKAREVPALVLDSHPDQRLGEDARRILLDPTLLAQPHAPAAAGWLQVAVEVAGDEARPICVPVG